MFRKTKLFMKIELPNIYSLYLSLLVEYQMCITIFIFQIQDTKKIPNVYLNSKYNNNKILFSFLFLYYENISLKIITNEPS